MYIHMIGEVSWDQKEDERRPLSNNSSMASITLQELQKIELERSIETFSRIKEKLLSLMCK